MNEDQKSVQVKAFNEWMRLSIEEPERFQNQYQSMRAFEKAIENGVEPDYGSVCVEYLEKLMVDVIEREVLDSTGTLPLPGTGMHLQFSEGTLVPGEEPHVKKV